MIPLSMALATLLTPPGHALPCTKYAFKGYDYQKTSGGEDEYLSADKKVTLNVKCHSPKKKYEDIVASLSKESSIRNTQGDAVYFEFNIHGRFKRVYVVSRSPVVQLTFSARKRYRRLLDATENLVEKYYKKTKITFSP